ncbi:MAG: hypothetical protein JWP03_2056 [Phycisphaerales bacterium]|jgi:hypothetical protein|nr:hypothetical protein [Phycisphaerales bacterium]
MDPHDPRPYADKSAEQLAAMADLLERHIGDFGRNLAAVREELHRRIPTGTVRAIPIDTREPDSGLQLGYRSTNVVVASTGAIGDSYADESRGYGIRAMLVAIPIVVVAVILLLVFVAIA